MPPQPRAEGPAKAQGRVPRGNRGRGVGSWAPYAAQTNGTAPPARRQQRAPTGAVGRTTHPANAEKRRTIASRGGRGKGGGELAGLKKQLHGLAADVLEGNVDRGDAAVVNQILNTLIRAIEQERKNLETGELAERLEAMEEVLKGRRSG